jgi:hypothetical protein
MKVENPALKEFARQVGDELTFAQVLIWHVCDGFELRHVDDRTVKAESLRAVPVDGARGLAQYTAEGGFRPLKSAPTLQKGWRIEAKGEGQLEATLNQIYPGAIADWHAARGMEPPVTDYREFAGRQTGMYRAMGLLKDGQVTEVIRNTCDKGHCLKRRLWTATGAAPDGPAEKSLIPCLEPCAILMESARLMLRAEQQKETVAACKEAENGV